MENIIEKKIHTDGEAYYFNTETKEKYGEIVGSLAWPKATGGFLIIAAVEFVGNTEFKARHIRVLVKANESDMDNFLKHALGLQRHFSPFMETIRFYGDTTSVEMMELLDQFNRDRRHRGLNPFYLTEAPQLKSSQKRDFYAQLIKTYTQPGRNILHFCDTALPSYLVGLSYDDISKKVLDSPPVAALSYALAVLSTWKPRRRETGMKAKQDRLSMDNPMEETT